MHSYCHAEPPIPAPHHAFGNAFFPERRASGMACQNGFLLRSGGWKASDPYCVNDRVSFSFRVLYGWNRNRFLAFNDGHWKGLVVGKGQRLSRYVI